ncbi:hypothetical protein DPMN_077063 [Dreissena polymorpha]|uniref:Uncharacterized protein n=1 Tax=Dreissena polymorpha TaxID=45954 RepID=A0A9D4BR10_DREPO|nr:hypothetical protein DPMN_077063 [Dreissena polymorpha]
MRERQSLLHNMHAKGLEVGGMAARAFRMLLSRVASSDLLASAASIPLCIDCLQAVPSLAKVSQVSVAMPQAL